MASGEREKRCRAKCDCLASLRRRARHFPVPTSFGRHANRLQRPAMNQSVLTINGLDISLGTAAAAFAVAVLALLVTIAIIAARAFRQRARETAGQMRRSEAMESRIADRRPPPGAGRRPRRGRQ